MLLIFLADSNTMIYDADGQIILFDGSLQQNRRLFR